MRAAVFDDRARKLAEEDAKAGRDPQVLNGDLAHYQDEYDDTYMVTLIDIANERDEVDIKAWNAAFDEAEQCSL